MAYLTNFPIPNYANSFRVPIFGSDTGGKSIFVKPNSGNDANDGLSPDSAVNTLTRALAVATANQNDVVYLFSESNTASTTSDVLSAQLDWNKDLVHLVGVCAPSKWAHRARISQLSTATGVDLVKLSANGCVFANFHIFHGVADATSKVALTVTGQRNAFFNLHVGGMGDLSKTQSVAGAASLFVDGGDENYFKDCVFGLDTATRDADPSELLFDSGATRNMFEDCIIQSYIDAAGFDSVRIADGTGIDRSLIFKNCLFFSKSTNKATTQTQVFDIPAGISQGAIILIDSYAFSDGGAVDWDGSDRGIIWNNAVAAAASAAGGIMTNQ